MLQPAVVVYVGDEQRALEVVRVLDRQLHRPIHVLTAAPESVDRLLTEDIDGVVGGPSLDGHAFQSVINAVSRHDTEFVLFDLTGDVTAVPDNMTVHYISPDASASDVAEELVGQLLESSLAADSEPQVSRFPGAYFALDSEWRVTDWDPHLASVTDHSPANTVGKRLFDLIPSWEDTGIDETCRLAIEHGEPVTREVLQGAGTGQYHLRVVPIENGGIECYLWNSEVFEGVEEATGEVVVPAAGQQDAETPPEREGPTLGVDRNDPGEVPETNLDSQRFEDTLDRITDAFFALDNEDRFVFLNSRAESILEVDRDEVLGVRFWDAFPAAMTTDFYSEFNEAMNSQEPTSFEERYEPTDSWLEVNAYPSEDGLSVFLRDITEQVRLQQKLEQLHEITRELIVAESDNAIASETVEAAEEILGFPLVAVWRYDETADLLNPLAWSDSIEDGNIQQHGPESEFIWKVHETGDHRILGFVPATTASSHHPRKVTSELLVPIGEYGVMGAYADERDAFDETDVELFRILASTVESAFARTRRERQLARQNERLDDFASIVSHDLRNPLSVASANVELAREMDDDGEYLDKIEDSLFRMEELIEDLLARARGDQELDPETMSLAETARSAWEGVDTADATLAIDGDAEFTADPGRLTQLFENLYRNAVEHGGEDVTLRVGPDADGFFIADDGPGIPEDRREEIFEQGVTHSEDGTGFGLAIVTDIVEGHGWTITATESRDGGARFEVGNVHTLSRMTET